MDSHQGAALFAIIRAEMGGDGGERRRHFPDERTGGLAHGILVALPVRVEPVPFVVRAELFQECGQGGAETSKVGHGCSRTPVLHATLAEGADAKQSRNCPGSVRPARTGSRDCEAQRVVDTGSKRFEGARPAPVSRLASDRREIGGVFG